MTRPTSRPRQALLLLTTAVLACSGDKTRTADATPAATAKQVGGATATPAQSQDTISRLADRGRILGDSTATVWFVMASDFQCPYCKQWHDVAFAGLVRDYVNTHKVRMAFLNMPLSMHQHAKPASEAAMCAAVQDKFWGCTTPSSPHKRFGKCSRAHSRCSTRWPTTIMSR